eukprot:4982167-Amphidinium_carterae.1
MDWRARDDGPKPSSTMATTSKVANPSATRLNIVNLLQAPLQCYVTCHWFLYPTKESVVQWFGKVNCVRLL